MTIEERIAKYNIHYSDGWWCCNKCGKQLDKLLIGINARAYIYEIAEMDNNKNRVKYSHIKERDELDYLDPNTTYCPYCDYPIGDVDETITEMILGRYETADEYVEGYYK